jgi:hypothetical protein
LAKPKWIFCGSPLSTKLLFETLSSASSLAARSVKELMEFPMSLRSKALSPLEIRRRKPRISETPPLPALAASGLSLSAAAELSGMAPIAPKSEVPNRAKSGCVVPPEVGRLTSWSIHLKKSSRPPPVLARSPAGVRLLVKVAFVPTRIVSVWLVA